jgi:hypothetical protein
MKTVEKYGIIELRFKTDNEPAALFCCEDIKTRVRGFKVSASEYALRFMPEREGEWTYTVEGVGESGTFNCVLNTGLNHGPVRAEGHHFRYADGSAYIPVGTTCYAWVHQTAELVAETLQTLEVSPFNKVRMCLFPKAMPYNDNDPELYPFEKDGEGKWDVSKPDFAFWGYFEDKIIKLGELGIEADLILFHPYDRWGFSKLTTDECLTYLDYCNRRLGAYRNIWWSLANEYDLMSARSIADWDAFGEKLHSEDTYRHLIGVHHCFAIFPKRGWLTHCSLQTKHIDRVGEWRHQYGLPAIIDECGYEGNIEYDWGNLSAFELVHRAWTAVTHGGFITHGETFHRDDEVLWWAKGGKLYGQSPERFAFLKALQYEIGDVDYSSASFVGNPNEEPGIESENIFAKVIRSLPDYERRLLMQQFAPSVVRNAY